jgi:hypothetical protein
MKKVPLPVLSGGIGLDQRIGRPLLRLQVASLPALSCRQDSDLVPPRLGGHEAPASFGLSTDQPKARAAAQPSPGPGDGLAAAAAISAGRVLRAGAGATLSGRLSTQAPPWTVTPRHAEAASGGRPARRKFRTLGSGPALSERAHPLRRARKAAATGWQRPAPAGPPGGDGPKCPGHRQCHCASDRATVRLPTERLASWGRLPQR